MVFRAALGHVGALSIGTTNVPQFSKSPIHLSVQSALRRTEPTPFGPNHIRGMRVSHQVDVPLRLTGPEQKGLDF